MNSIRSRFTARLLTASALLGSLPCATRADSQRWKPDIPRTSIIGVGQRATPLPATITAARLQENPLVTVHTSASLGDDVNGPTVIRVPEWIEHPLGRYYMYFAHHKGTFIRLAYADSITGPWKVFEPGVLNVRATALFRPQPDPPENVENQYTHVASPEIYVDSARRRLVMWFHGFWTEGKQWPVGLVAAQQWLRENGYGQYTQVAESGDGIHFDVRPAITRESYLRVFEHDRSFYAMARLGVLLRSKDPFASFETGPNPFEGGPFANRVRHVALMRRNDMMYVFFTAIGDAPERVFATTLNLAGDWKGWKISAPVELLKPEASYECPNLPNIPSERGEINGPARQLRDPGVFEENGRTWLFYSICGEQGIAGAELTLH